MRTPRGKIIAVVSVLALYVALMFCIDFVAMRTSYRLQRELLADVLHFPDFRKPGPEDPEYNSDWIRDEREAGEFAAADTNVLFLGDSFVYGFRVWPHEALPRELERRARERHPDRRINVANFGWVSSSPYLSLELLKSIGAKYNPDVVILGVDMTDIHDDIKYEIYAEKPGVHAWLDVWPSAVLALKDAAQRMGTHERWFGYPAERFFAVQRPLDASRVYLDRYLRKNLDALFRYSVDELHARFLVVVFPRHYQYSQRESPKDWERSQFDPASPYVLEPLRWFDELRAQVDYPIHSLLDTFRDSDVFPTTFYDDPHWTTAGIALAAEAVLNAVEEEHLLDGAPGPAGGR